jgi:hypothetical protein
MLDWTTSFLSDETIIKPSSESVKHFLYGHNIQVRTGDGTLPVGKRVEKCPAFLRGIDENQEATPVALRRSTLLPIEKAIRAPALSDS